MEKDKLPERVRLRDGVIVLFKKRYKKPHKLAGKINNNWHCIINVKRGSRGLYQHKLLTLNKLVNLLKRSVMNFRFIIYRCFNQS